MHSENSHPHADSYLSTAPIANLIVRAKLLKRLRDFFDSTGFIEVQTPTLSQDTVIDRHIDLIEVSLGSSSNGSPLTTYYLQSSPEACMKRLLASGMPAIYQVGPVFRLGERGQRHNPEFTMAEWYHVGDSFELGMQRTSDLLTHLLETPACEYMKFQDAFHNAVGVDCFESSVTDLANRSVALGVVDRPDWSSDWDDWVHLLFSMKVQPTLGLGSPCLITHFPASQAALAQISKTDPRTAERFELFYKGLELANGYHELLDAEVLRKRSHQSNQERLSDGKKSLPVESRLLAAMDKGIPPSTGCALGFDRVVMLATEATSIEEVIPFPFERA